MYTFFGPLCIHGDSDVRQTEIHTALVPDPSAFQVEMAVEKFNGHKSPDTDQSRGYNIWP